MRLSELRTGEKGVIVKVLGHGGFRKRIVEMGFIKGKTVEVILNAPLKDPIKYRLLSYEISLRRQEADMIEVVSEQEARTMQNPYHGSITEDVPVSESELVALAKGKRRTINVALVGNPNCGKTSLFNIASGAHEHVGNYSGVTVDAKEGFFDFQGYHFRIVDLPGTYSLSAYTPEELYVRKHIIEETPDVIINVADSSNLERNFYLTTQLIDMNVRMVIALNMYDELESSGNKLDYIKLSQLIGVPMIPTVCRRGEGIDQLFHVIIGIYEGGDFLSQNAGNFLHVILDILGIRSNDGAVVMVVRIFELITLIEQRRIEDELNTLTDQPGHMTVRQLCRVTLGFTRDRLNTELVDLTVGAGREHHAVAQFGEECEPERIVLVHIQYSGDTYHTSGSLVDVQGFIGE